MADQSIHGGAIGASVWSEFQKRNSGHRFLKKDPLYSLPKILISAINSGIPGFFSDSDLKFENDLSEVTRDGFFLGKPLDFFPDMDPKNASKKVLECAKSIHGIMNDSRKKTHIEILSSTQPERDKKSITDAVEKRNSDRFAFDIKEHDELNCRIKSYIGWLYLNKHFIDSIKMLIKNDKLKIEEFGGFHKFDLELRFQKKFKNESYEKTYNVLNDFYRAWNLNGFYTWDIPEISRPKFSGYASYNEKVPQEGVHIFLPWYCVKGRLFDFDKKIRQVERNENLLHLIPFFEMEKNKGYVYYENMYNFYRYFFW